MSTNEKRMSVTSKVILATEEVINRFLKKYLGHYKCDFGQQTDVNHWKKDVGHYKSDLSHYKGDLDH